MGGTRSARWMVLNKVRGAYFVKGLICQLVLCSYAYFVTNIAVTQA